ncbi:hypothetical protein ACFZAR_41325 [Streptomyces sp. NPDC008222]|uniref:hypothetical protein n=1 Tax=Streptomyces sp. NPDC008222 TaxID=3364820 RepID=UPI0036F0CCB3
MSVTSTRGTRHCFFMSLAVNRDRQSGAVHHLPRQRGIAGRQQPPVQRHHDGRRAVGLLAAQGEQAGRGLGDRSEANQPPELGPYALDVLGLAAEVRGLAPLAGAPACLGIREGGQDVLADGIVGRGGVCRRGFVAIEREDDLADSGEFGEFVLDLAQPIAELGDLCAQPLGSTDTAVSRPAIFSRIGLVIGAS